MTKQKRPGTDVESLLGLLADKDGVARQKARRSLVALGKPAVSSLTGVLLDSRFRQLRWEAAKALGAIGDSGAIPALMSALEDRDADVRWLAAEGLKKFKKAAWPPLLRAVIECGPDSVSLRQGAHHVLRNQNAAGFNDLLATLKNALKAGIDQEAAPWAAYQILKKMKVKS